jgi:hypothetical protein
MSKANEKNFHRFHGRPLEGERRLEIHVLCSSCFSGSHTFCRAVSLLLADHSQSNKLGSNTATSIRSMASTIQSLDAFFPISEEKSSESIDDEHEKEYKLKRH